MKEEEKEEELAAWMSKVLLSAVRILRCHGSA
jgi:hypothetical protein